MEPDSSVNRLQLWAEEVQASPAPSPPTSSTSSPHSSADTSTDLDPSPLPPTREVLKARKHWINFFKKIDFDAQRIDKSNIKDLVRRYGIPAEIRGDVWLAVNGVEQCKKSSAMSYNEIKSTFDGLVSPHFKQIEKDLRRSLPDNAAFESEEALSALRRVLCIYSFINPEIGYCQSMNFVCALFLLFVDEGDAFWLLQKTIEELLPPNYYSQGMIGVRTDHFVLVTLLSQKLPKVYQHLKKHDIPMSGIISGWFMCLFVNVLPIEATLRFFDSFFIEGSKMLFRVALALFKINEKLIVKAKDFGEIYSVVNKMAHNVDDISKLMEMSFNKDWLGSLPMSKITSIRVDFSRKLSWEVHREIEDRKKEPVRNYDTSGAMSPRGPLSSPAPLPPASQSDSANKPVLYYRRGDPANGEDAQTSQRSATIDSSSSQGFSKPPGPKQMRSNTESPEKSDTNASASFVPRNEGGLLRQESAPRLIAKQPVNATRFNKTDFAAPTSPTPTPTPTPTPHSSSSSSYTQSSVPTGFSTPVSPTCKNSQGTQMQSATTVPRLGQVYAKPKPVGARKSLIASGRSTTLPLPLSDSDPLPPSTSSSSSSSPTSPQGSPPILGVTLSSSAPPTSSFPPPPPHHQSASSSPSSPTSSPSPGARVAPRKKIVCPPGPPPPRPNTPGGPLNTGPSSQTNDLRRHLQRSPSAVETRTKDQSGPPPSLLAPQTDFKRPATPRSNMLASSSSGSMERGRNPTVTAKARPPPPPPPCEPAPLNPDEEAYEIFAHVARNVEPQISYSTPSATTLEAMESPDRLGIRFNNRFRPLSFLVIGGLNTIRPGGPGSSSLSSSGLHHHPSSSSSSSSFSTVPSLTTPGSPGTRPLRNAAGKRPDLDPPK